MDVCQVVALLVLLPLVAQAAELSPADSLLVQGLRAEAKRLKLPIHVLDRGIAHDEPNPPMTAFLRKLLGHQPSVKLVALGGSITSGYAEGMDPPTSFPNELAAMFQKVFPRTTFEVANLGVGGSGAGYATMCQAIDVPDDVDLFLVEYTVNAYSGMCTCADSPYVAGYEALLRRLMRDHPGIPIVMFATFLWAGDREDMEPPYKLLPYYYTGQSLHATLASYYSLPFISARNAMYKALCDGTLTLRLKDMILDLLHPSNQGCLVYASLIMHLIARKLEEVLHGDAPEQTLAELRSYKPPPPLVTEAPFTGTCIPAADVKDIQYTMKQGFQEYKEFHGYSGTKPGATLVWELNSTIPGSKPGQATTVAILYYRSWRGGMGSAWLECVSGCSCKKALLESHSKIKTTELTSGKVLVTPHEECKVKLTISNTTMSGGHRFRFEGFVVFLQPPHNKIDMLA